MRRTAAALAAVVVVALSGCAPAADARPVVAVTTNILADVVDELVGDQAEVLDLMPAGADPHSFQVSAQEAARLRAADAIVTNGLGLEEGMAAHVEAAADDGVPVVIAGDAVETVEWTTEDDSGVDPHFWTDPERMRDAVAAIAAELAEHVDGVDETALQEATDGYLAKLDALDAELTAAFGAIPEERRALVTNHHVFGYLAERYDFAVVGAVIPSGTTLAAPSARDLESLSEAIREAGVATIFVDSSQPARLAEVLASEAGVDVAIMPLHTESLSEPGGGAATYLEMMRTNAADIVMGLSGPPSS